MLNSTKIIIKENKKIILDLKHFYAVIVVIINIITITLWQYHFLLYE